jgi:thiamine biosynthesis lipoprotein
MGTLFSVRVDDEIDPGAIHEVFAMWADVEERFSTFTPTSEVSRIGRGELAVDDAHRDVRHVLAACEEFEVATAGRFSIRPGRPGGPGIDPAGYVKGWSVDEAALMLRSSGATNFMIYAGGDVLCAGAPSDDDMWRVGVRHPAAPDSFGAMVSMNRGAVASSGTYERGNHIWGPNVSETTIVGVSVVGPSLGAADALSTAIFADQAANLDWLAAYPEYGIIVFDARGAVRWSASLADRVAIPALTDDAPHTDAGR